MNINNKFVSRAFCWSSTALVVASIDSSLSSSFVKSDLDCGSTAVNMMSNQVAWWNLRSDMSWTCPRSGTVLGRSECHSSHGWSEGNELAYVQWNCDEAVGYGSCFCGFLCCRETWCCEISMNVRWGIRLKWVVVAAHERASRSSVVGLALAAEGWKLSCENRLVNEKTTCRWYMMQGHERVLELYQSMTSLTQSICMLHYVALVTGDGAFADIISEQRRHKLCRRAIVCHLMSLSSFGRLMKPFRSSTYQAVGAAKIATHINVARWR